VSTDGLLVTRYGCGECAEGKLGRYRYSSSLTVATDRTARVCQVTVEDDGSIVRITLGNTKDDGRCAEVSCELAQLRVSGGCRGVRGITIVCSSRPSIILVECVLLPFVEVVVGSLSSASHGRPFGALDEEEDMYRRRQWCGG